MLNFQGSFKKLTLFYLCALALILSTQVAYANTLTVTRGPQATRLELNWSILNGSNFCNGTTNYPTLGDGIEAGWTVAHPVNALGYGNTTAPWGTQISAPDSAGAGFPLGYTFTCTETSEGASATSYLIVLGCSGATPIWNGSDCVPNTPPTANAGPNRTLVFPDSTFGPQVGSGTDTDGVIASYNWSRVSGPVVASISSPNSASTNFTGMTATGTYVFRLTVTDDLGSTDIDNMQVVIPDPGASFTTIPSCTILNNQYGCRDGVSWTSADVSAVDLTDCTGGIYVAGMPSGPQSYNVPGVFIPYNSGCYQIRVSGTAIVLGQVNGTSACVAGSPWDTVNTTGMPVGWPGWCHHPLPDIDVDPPPGVTNFGTIPVGNVSTIDFTVKNLGESGSLLSGTASSPNPRFTCVVCDYNNIPVGGSVVITFTFTPTGPPFGSWATNITFTNTQGASQLVGVQGGSESSLIFTPTPLDFSDVVTVKDKSLSVEICNVSSSAIAPFTPTINVPLGPFSCTSGCVSAGLPAGGCRSITIRFQPTVTGVYNGTINLPPRLPFSPDETIFMTGVGVPPLFEVREE